MNNQRIIEMLEPIERLLDDYFIKEIYDKHSYGSEGFRLKIFEARQTIQKLKEGKA